VGEGKRQELKEEELKRQGGRKGGVWDEKRREEEGKNE
jgi:hypothetical protein